MRRWTITIFGLIFGLAPQSTLASPIPVTRGTHVYFTGSDNQRQVDFDVDLGTALPLDARVQLRFALRCPNDRCDAWDRRGSFGVLHPTADGGTVYFELMRFMTPYGIGGEWVADVTDFVPYLQGTTRFRVFIDTWVGPGHPQGDGWWVDADLEATASSGEPRVAAIIPVIPQTDLVYGDPSAPARVSRSIAALAPNQRAKLKMIITGHGQGNAENCAEFCPKTHSVTLGEWTYTREIWRADCAETVDPNQRGNWWSPRAGWCPGDQVVPWEEDVTAALASGSAGTFVYEVEAYENTCRPEAPVCTGCVFGTGCAFDGGLHTEPHYAVTGYIVVYE